MFSVQVCAWNPVYAHIFTLVVVMCINCWLLIRFVFPSEGMNRRKFVAAYLCSSVFLRVSEWGVFALMVQYFGVDYRLSICLVNPAFALIKFVFLRGRAYASDSAIKSGS